MTIIIGIGISILIVLVSLIFRAARLLHLTIPLLYITIVTIFFNDWYTQNTTLAHIILAIITGVIIINLIAKVIKKINILMFLLWTKKE